MKASDLNKLKVLAVQTHEYKSERFQYLPTGTGIVGHEKYALAGFEMHPKKYRSKKKMEGKSLHCGVVGIT